MIFCVKRSKGERLGVKLRGCGGVAQSEVIARCGYVAWELKGGCEEEQEEEWPGPARLFMMKWLRSWKQLEREYGSSGFDQL